MRTLPHFFAFLFLVCCTPVFAQTTTTVAGPTIKLSWGAVTQGTLVSTTGGKVTTSPITLTGATSYNLYQGACNPSATFVKVQTGIGGTSAVVSAGIVSGVTYGFRLTAVNSTTAGITAPESAQSPTVCAVIGTVASTPPANPPPATTASGSPNAPGTPTVLPN